MIAMIFLTIKIMAYVLITTKIRTYDGEQSLSVTLPTAHALDDVDCEWEVTSSSAHVKEALIRNFVYSND